MAVAIVNNSDFTAVIAATRASFSDRSLLTKTVADALLSDSHSVNNLNVTGLRRITFEWKLYMCFIYNLWSISTWTHRAELSNWSLLPILVTKAYFSDSDSVVDLIYVSIVVERTGVRTSLFGTRLIVLNAARALFSIRESYAFRTSMIARLLSTTSQNRFARAAVPTFIHANFLWAVIFSSKWEGRTLATRSLVWCTQGSLSCTCMRLFWQLFASSLTRHAVMESNVCSRVKMADFSRWLMWHVLVMAMAVSMMIRWMVVCTMSFNNVNLYWCTSLFEL